MRFHRLAFAAAVLAVGTLTHQNGKEAYVRLCGALILVE
jgi:hypothetical protein